MPNSYAWDPVFHGEAFTKLKTLLKTAPVLQFFDEKADIVVQADASSLGLGACLLQNGKPCSYASRSLNKTEQNNSQIEKEMLSILFALEHWHTYVFGRKIIVQRFKMITSHC